MALDFPIESAYIKGAEAFKRNLDIEYDHNSPHYREAMRGWNDAYLKQLRKTKSIEKNQRITKNEQKKTG